MNPKFIRNIQNAMSVDIEEYFFVSAFENIVSLDAKNNLPKRAAYATHKLLDLFAEKNIKATFFTLSSLGETEKSLIHRIIAEGHELASHGIKHDRVRDLTAEQFFDDITRSKHTLEDISGVSVTGYRAPSFSIGKDTPFAYDMLIKAGYTYSSSSHPIKHDHYGDDTAPLEIHKPIAGADFYEFPITVLECFGRRLPIGGGGWFRLMPFFIFEALLKKASRAGRPLIFYTHPWEYDPEQPVIPNLPLKTRFRHYVNLSRTYSKLSLLLEQYHWTRCDKIIEKYKSILKDTPQNTQS
jgi:polysaccharide deacetylase family protein (PEP-CTERM system associated)